MSYSSPYSTEEGASDLCYQPQEYPVVLRLVCAWAVDQNRNLLDGGS